MKRVSQMTALAMALGLACASSWAAELAKPLLHLTSFNNKMAKR